ncbi:MAG: TonB family protein [Pusillimonas sp.]
MWATERKLWLYIGIAVSLCIHATILTLRFAAPDARRPPAQSLEVTLVNTRTEAAPTAPQVLAQQNLNAGGTLGSNAVASSPLPLTAPDAADEIVLEALRKRQAALEALQEHLLTQLEAQRQTPAAHQPNLLQHSEAPGPDNQVRDSAIISARIAALKDRIEQYNAQPRQQFIGPSARQASHARYVEAWRQKIELIGTTHYPAQASGKIYGSLQLTAYIRKDGSLERVEINTPSSEPALNLAARRIIQLAAPFPPLPPEVARNTDILAITRTWHFTNDQLTTQ